nr:MAG TPA: chitin synthase regulator [Caudoviricetes sp.]
MKILKIVEILIICFSIYFYLFLFCAINRNNFRNNYSIRNLFIYY